MTAAAPTVASAPASAAAYGFHAPRVARVLDRLHRDARRDVFRIALRSPLLAADMFGWRRADPARLSHRTRDIYFPVSREQGQFLYLMARSIGARRIVEFGTSFGISTLYLAAAVRDNGGGAVIGSELEPSKHARASEHLREAGLDDIASVRLGDAQATLADVAAPLDLVLLDGWKDGYLPILHLLTPKLRAGALVLADNIYTFKRALRPYVEYVQSGQYGFVSTTLDLADGFELSVYTGP